ncbi:Chitin binding domain 3 protein [Operophtera brumata]|uniref:Chitin binding domain 3 protein n=1 Tax=Operophtera brumata TaxID=104452 RepID=A0A0L7L4P4_OPEBR|nr:Chitin binding domain 3 protein [Operophtera brumata]
MWTTLLMSATAVALVHGHGRVLDPPGRGTAWRLGYNARANYDDDALFCGGFYHQHSVNGGKCGLCGDPYDESPPRAHERGGIYDPGLIVGSYEEGSTITITVEITAHHLGYWEFRICPDADRPDQDCFDDNLLELEEGGTKYYPNHGSNKYYVNYRLPEGLTCENCVLQWRYTCGNNWGDCNNGTQALGCGNQETFGACSDIAIVGNPDAPKYIEVDSLLLTKVEDQGNH